MIEECLQDELTCTEPGNAPGQSCAGSWAAGTGLGQAPPQLHRDPAAKRGGGGGVTVNTATLNVLIMSCSLIVKQTLIKLERSYANT